MAFLELVLEGRYPGRTLKQWLDALEPWSLSYPVSLQETTETTWVETGLARDTRLGIENGVEKIYLQSPVERVIEIM